MSTESAERYLRAFDPDNEYDSLAKLARLVASGSEVLDLGCGPGLLGRHLSQAKACLVDGMDREDGLFDSVRPFYRDLWRADLDRMPWPVPAGRRYDAIIAADVLEHSARPDAILDYLTPLLKDGGRLLVSMPNVGYGAVIAELLEGEFRYRPTGILDETHLRFFTRKGLVELLERAGFTIANLDAVRIDPSWSEFGTAALDSLPQAVRDFVISRPDADAFQFIIDATPGRKTR